MPARIEIAPELLAEGKYFYEQTLMSVEEIAARMTISRSALYARIDEEKWQRRRYSPSAAADEAPVAAAVVPVQVPGLADGACVAEPDQSPADAVTIEKRAALHARAFRAVELEMDTIEAAMKQLGHARAFRANRARIGDAQQVVARCFGADKSRRDGAAQ